ncbi:MAG: hypothetical protein IT462_15050 [Planctomycetes bacterium]|nr:hypothetical protein [Planctomycetota bacterium]
MTIALKEAIGLARQRAARGDFVAARRELDQVRRQAEADPEGARGLAGEISQFTRTLEVLEALDAVRAMLREGDHSQAADAAARIADRLSADDYAELGIAGAALTLLSRAGDLARNAAGRRETPEVRAFVDYMASELATLERQKFSEPLREYVEETRSARATTETRSASTLGELLSRRPWRSGMQTVAVEPATEPARRPPPERSTSVPVRDAVPTQSEQAPVLGKILIEQEPKAAGVPMTQTAPAGEGDAFDIVSKAVLRNWYVVLGMMMIFGLIGYLFAAAAPPKYISRALLQRVPPSNLRAPVTGNTSQYVPTLPRATVLKLATLPGFHDEVARKLNVEGWKPHDQAEVVKFQPITGDDVTSSLQVTVDESTNYTYYIEFAATHSDRRMAEALAGTAANAFMEKHRWQVVQEAEDNQRTYTARQADLANDLKQIADERLHEFKVGPDTTASGRSVTERVGQLMMQYNDARTRLGAAETDLAAATASLANYETILKDKKTTPELIPGPNSKVEDPELTRLQGQLGRIEDEILEIDRKRAGLGPEHPLIKNRLPELYQDRRYLEDRIDVIRSRKASEDPTNMVPNPSYMDAKLKAEDARGKKQQYELQKGHLQGFIQTVEVELNSLKDKLSIAEDRNRRESAIIKQKERTDIILEDLGAVLASAGRELQLIQPAVRATPIEPKLIVSIAAGLVMGLIVGVAIAIGLLRRRRLSEAV